MTKIRPWSFEETFCGKLCGLLGLDPEVTASITIECGPSEFPLIKVEQALSDKASGEVINTLRQFVIAGAVEDSFIATTTSPEPAK